jgi:hypothetical protein
VVTLGFSLEFNTKPNTVKYAVAGTVTLEGPAADIKKRLEVNPKTQIPQILFTVYQHIFNHVYTLSSILSTPYPPPDLLHPMAEKIQILPSSSASKGEPEKGELKEGQAEQSPIGGEGTSPTSPSKT